MHSINRSGARRPRNGNQALALVSVVSRKSSAARAAHRRQASSTFVSGQSLLCCHRCPPCFYPSISKVSLPLLLSSQGMRQGCARQRCRSNWPETNVGAGLPAMRRAGGARSHRRRKHQGEHLSALTRLRASHLRQNQKNLQGFAAQSPASQLPHRPHRLQAMCSTCGSWLAGDRGRSPRQRYQPGRTTSPVARLRITLGFFRPPARRQAPGPAGRGSTAPPATGSSLPGDRRGCTRWKSAAPPARTVHAPPGGH